MKIPALNSSYRVTGCIVFAAVWLLGANNCLAHAPRAREKCGTVRIDREHQTLTVTSDAKAKPLDAVWKRSTEFYRDGKSVSASALADGARICVYYHSPFFGKRYVTKVVWTTEDGSRKSGT